MTEEKKIYKWFIFGSVSTFLAFFLPVFLWVVANSYRLIFSSNVLLEDAILDIFLVCVLWHAKYRADTLISDFTRQQKKNTYKTIVNILFYIAISLLFICNIGFLSMLAS